jgi:tetratricopeptide (TPR) repeat protein
MHSRDDLTQVYSYVEKWWDKINEGHFYREQYDAFEGDLVKAKQLLDNILQQNPDNEDAITALLRWHLCCARGNSGFAGNRDRIEKAISHMKAVVDMVPTAAEYWALLGVCYKQIGNKELAIEQFNRALQIDPTCAEARDELNGITADTSPSKGGCFIATAAYGSPYVHEITVLKELRDSYMLTNLPGKALVNLYYWLSPPIANRIAKRNWLKALTKTLLIIPLVMIANNIIKKAK